MSFQSYRKLPVSTLPLLTQKSLRDSNEKSDSEKPLKIGFFDITQIDIEHKDDPEIMPTPQSFQTKKKQGMYEDNALLLRRRKKFEKRKYFNLDATLEIRDPNIKAALRVVLKDARYLNLSSSSIEIKEPYRELFWFRRELEEYRKQTESTPDRHLSFNLLSNFIDERMHKTFESYDSMVPNWKIDFDNLWTLFRPGSLVVSTAQGLYEAFLVASISSITLVSTTVLCWGWGCDLNNFGLYERKLEIKYFQGSQEILDLDVYPLEHLPPERRNELYEELVQRGRRWKALAGLCHRFYKGIAWKLERAESQNLRANFFNRHEVESYERTRQYVCGRVVLDFATSLHFNPGSVYPLVSWTHVEAPTTLPSTGTLEWNNFVTTDSSTEDVFVKLAKSSSHDVSDRQALLCPPTVRGYSLEDKCWMDFLVDDIQDIEWDNTCFMKLQIDNEARTHLECLVKQHTASGQGFKDVVAGKGTGLTFLFHGPPGSGKTLTAEVISEHTHRPLLRITSGDLGTEPSLAETRLRETFKLAQAWDAVLLLDEADVFLAERKTGDIAHNAFVTIFLRSMEYYSGIMILTTNQRQSFDEAFASRIHLHLPYPPLNAVLRKAIWKDLLDAQDTAHRLDDKALTNLSEKYQLNGREIKNIIAMGVSICKSRGKQLDEKSIEVLCNFSRGT